MPQKRTKTGKLLRKEKDRGNKNPTHPLEDRSEISKINYFFKRFMTFSK